MYKSSEKIKEKAKKNKNALKRGEVNNVPKISIYLVSYFLPPNFFFISKMSCIYC